MRNRNLVTFGMIGLLLVGLAFAAWFLLRDPGKPPAPNFAGQPELADKPDDTTPLQPGNTSANTAADKPDPKAGESNPKPEPEPGPGPEAVLKPDDTTSSVETATATMTATGRVVLRESGRPALGAVVKPEPAPWPNWQGERPEIPEATLTGEATTDGSGNFSLDVTVRWPRAKGTNTAYLGGITLVARLAGYAPGRTAILYLTAGDGWKDLEISLTFPAAARGRVVDADGGAGVAGAVVEFSSFSRTTGMVAPRQLVTDAEGHFSVSDLAADDYTINIRAEGYADFNGWTDPGGRRDLSRGGDNDLGEFVVQRAAALLGMVLGPDGKPAIGAQVAAAPAGRMAWTPTQDHSTGKDGRFLIEDLRAGTFSVQITCRGIGHLTVENVVLAAGERKDLGTLRLNAGITLRGTVQDASGKPVAGAGLKLINGRNGIFGALGELADSATSAEDGSFVISGLRPGNPVLEVAKAGFARHARMLELAADTSVVIVMQVAGAVVGRITGPDGLLPPDTRVRCVNQQSPEYASVKSYGQWVLGEGSTPKDDGSFRIGELETGTYTLYVEAGALGVTTLADLKVESGQDTDVGLITLALGGRISIRVTDDGAPVADLRVGLNSGPGWPAGSHLGVTDGSGTVVLENVPAGDYYVHTSRDDDSFDTESMRLRRVKVKSGELTEIHIELQARTGATLSGRVTLGGRAAFKEITLLGTGDISTFLKNGPIAEGGFFEVRGLKPGRYTVHFRAENTDLTFRDEIEIGDEDKTYDRDFKQLAVSGRVTLPAEKVSMARSVKVRISNLEGAGQFNEWLAGRVDCDAEGKFRFASVQPGRYRLTALLEAVGVAVAEVTVADADLTDVSLVLSQDVGTLRVRIAKVHGELPPMPFGQVQLVDASGNLVSLGGEASGMLILSNSEPTSIGLLLPGTYTMKVRASGCLSREYEGVKITKGETTEIAIEVTVGASLSLGVSNTEVTQEMLDAAQVRYFDAAGKEVPRESNIWDAWGQSSVPEKPTLLTRYITPQVKEVRVRVAGYKEVVVPVTFEAGKTTSAQVTLEAE